MPVASVLEPVGAFLASRWMSGLSGQFAAAYK